MEQLLVEIYMLARGLADDGRWEQWVSPNIMEEYGDRLREMDVRWHEIANIPLGTVVHFPEED